VLGYKEYNINLSYYQAQILLMFQINAKVSVQEMLQKLKFGLPFLEKYMKIFE